MADIYTLYGSYASYYTAKVRSYLRKKGIPFVERLPSDPDFRNVVRPASGSHRIPQLRTPEGEVIQDSVAIVDALEARFTELPAFPSTPRQRSFVHLMELLGGEGLCRLAWLHRWLFAENEHFVKMDFGRSFRPQGSDEELLKYGELIAGRMRSYGLPESTPAARAALDERYKELLALFERHLVEHPYFLGGHPSAADYAVMGAMHAHLGRDPAGLRVMQDNAPRTFRWVEHMLMPEVQAPEFFDRPVEYLADDRVPVTALAIVEFIARRYGQQYVLGGVAFNQAMQRIKAGPGYELAPDEDQPMLAKERVTLTTKEQESEHQHAANLYAVWLAQRSQRHFQALSANDQQKVTSLFQDETVQALLGVPVSYPLERVHNRLLIAS